MCNNVIIIVVAYLDCVVFYPGILTICDCVWQARLHVFINTRGQQGCTYRCAQWLRRTEVETQMSKCVFEYFADLIKVLQMNCLMPNWHGIVTSLSTLPASLPSQHIDCVLLAPQSPLLKLLIFILFYLSALALLALSCTVYTLLTLVWNNETTSATAVNYIPKLFVYVSMRDVCITESST